MSDNNPTSHPINPPTPVQVPIELTKGQTAYVDLIDSDLGLLRWHATPGWKKTTYYAGRRVVDIPKTRGKVIFMHNVILERVLGRTLTDGELADHADGNGLNNSRSNIRLADQSRNSQNSRRKCHNRSGYKGVTRNKPGRKKPWRATIVVNKHQISLGTFDTPEEAHSAYCEAAKCYFGEFARTE